MYIMYMYRVYEVYSVIEVCHTFQCVYACCGSIRFKFSFLLFQSNYHTHCSPKQQKIELNQGKIEPQHISCLCSYTQASSECTSMWNPWSSFWPNLISNVCLDVWKNHYSFCTKVWKREKVKWRNESTQTWVLTSTQ